MATDLAAIAAEAAVLAVAAVRTYGKTVLTRASDDVGDASARAGLQLLQRIFGRRGQREQIPSAIGEVIANPGDEDYEAQLRLTIRKALETDRRLADEVVSILRNASNTPQAAQHVVSGRDANVSFFGRDGFVAGRDIKLSRRPAGHRQV